MAKLNAIKIDSVKAEEGVWFPHHIGFEFLVARLGNQKYKNYLAKLMRTKGKKFLRGGDMNLLAIEKLARRAAARHIILDWKNIEDEDGNAIPYSEEKCFEIITDPDFDVLYKDIMDFAQDESEYNEQFVEESAGN